jgi:uncharacterized low-complexity protein
MPRGLFVGRRRQTVICSSEFTKPKEMKGNQMQSINRKAASATVFAAALFAGAALAETTTTVETVPAVNGTCSASSSSSSSSSGNGSSYTSVSTRVVNNGNGTCTITTTRTTGGDGSATSPPNFLNPNSPICQRFPFFSFCK